jgi:hypothetical protein
MFRSNTSRYCSRNSAGRVVDPPVIPDPDDDDPYPPRGE